MSWFLYVIKGNNGVYYKGITNNLEKRLHQHELKQNKTTRLMKYFTLIHVEIFDSRKDARQTEKFFKSGFGREIIKELF